MPRSQARPFCSPGPAHAAHSPPPPSSQPGHLTAGRLRGWAFRVTDFTHSYSLAAPTSTPRPLLQTQKPVLPVPRSHGGPRSSTSCGCLRLGSCLAR